MIDSRTTKLTTIQGTAKCFDELVSTSTDKNQYPLTFTTEKTISIPLLKRVKSSLDMW